MINKKIIIIGILVVILVALFFVFDKKLENNKESAPVREQVIQEAVNKLQETINTKHQYKEGLHTYVGSFSLPNACYNYKISVSEMNNKKVIDIEYVAPPTNNCQIEGKTERKFKVTVPGEQDMEAVARIDGEFFNLNIFEIGPDEDIDSIEIQTKG